MEPQQCSPSLSNCSLRMQILLRSDTENYLLEMTSSFTIIILGVVGMCSNGIGFLATLLSLLRENRLTMQLNCFLSFSMIVYALGPTVRHCYLIYRQMVVGHRVIATNACGKIFSLEVAAFTFAMSACWCVAIRFAILFIINDRVFKRKLLSSLYIVVAFVICALHAFLESYYQWTNDLGPHMMRCSLLSGTARMSSSTWKISLAVGYGLMIPFYTLLYGWLKYRIKASRRISPPFNEQMLNLFTETNFSTYALCCILIAAVQLNLMIFSIIYSRYRTVASITIKTLLRLFRIVPNMMGFIFFIAFYCNCSYFKTAVVKLLCKKVHLVEPTYTQQRLSIVAVKPTNRANDHNKVDIVDRKKPAA